MIGGHKASNISRVSTGLQVRAGCAWEAECFAPLPSSLNPDFEVHPSSSEKVPLSLKIDLRKLRLFHRKLTSTRSTIKTLPLPLNLEFTMDSIDVPVLDSMPTREQESGQPISSITTRNDLEHYTFEWRMRRRRRRSSSNSLTTEAVTRDARDSTPNASDSSSEEEPRPGEHVADFEKRKSRRRRRRRQLRLTEKVRDFEERADWRREERLRNGLIDDDESDRSHSCSRAARIRRLREDNAHTSSLGAAAVAAYSNSHREALNDSSSVDHGLDLGFSSAALDIDNVLDGFDFDAFPEGENHARHGEIMIMQRSHSWSDERYDNDEPTYNSYTVTRPSGTVRDVSLQHALP